MDTDISLEALAEESGYSRAHFLRMFREATGVTPHQYVLDVRLRHAQEWLRKKNSALIDIAAVLRILQPVSYDECVSEASGRNTR